MTVDEKKIDLWTESDKQTSRLRKSLKTKKGDQLHKYGNQWGDKFLNWYKTMLPSIRTISYIGEQENI